MREITIERIDHANTREVEANAASVSALVDVINKEYASTGIGTALPPTMSPAEVKESVERIGDRGGIFFCKDGDTMVGFARLSPAPEDEQTAVMGVWVRSSHRRRGIGTELARVGTEYAKSAGFAKLRGTIPGNNQGALSFFSAVGPIVHLEGGGMGYELPV